MRSGVDNLRPMVGDQFQQHHPQHHHQHQTHHHHQNHTHQQHQHAEHHQNNQHQIHQQRHYILLDPFSDLHSNLDRTHLTNQQQQQHQAQLNSLDLSVRNLEVCPPILVDSDDESNANNQSNVAEQDVTCTSGNITPISVVSPRTSSSSLSYHDGNYPFGTLNNSQKLQLINNSGNDNDDVSIQRAIRYFSPNLMDQNYTATGPTVHQHIPYTGQHQNQSSNNIYHHAIHHSNHNSHHVSFHHNLYNLSTTANSLMAAPFAVTTNPHHYVSLNQKRESVITFNHNNINNITSNNNDANSPEDNCEGENNVDQQNNIDNGQTGTKQNHSYNRENSPSPDTDEDNDENKSIDIKDSTILNLNKRKLNVLKMRPIKLANKDYETQPHFFSRSTELSMLMNDSKTEVILVHNIPLTLDQIICICQVLQHSDLEKLEKFIYNIPLDNDICNKNELIIRAKAIAAYRSGNFKQVYELLEMNNFNVKYHQELQSLWNNAHYKEHEMKRGHPPGAVEKYRIRKKYQFPRTIWDGEEYVYCFKEKNRRILKEFYQKCNLPTQEDKLKLSSETQLTVVQSKIFNN